MENIITQNVPSKINLNIKYVILGLLVLLIIYFIFRKGGKSDSELVSESEKSDKIEIKKGSSIMKKEYVTMFANKIYSAMNNSGEPSEADFASVLGVLKSLRNKTWYYQLFNEFGDKLYTSKLLGISIKDTESGIIGKHVNTPRNLNYWLKDKFSDKPIWYNRIKQEFLRLQIPF